MRSLALLLLALPAFGQCIEIHYSRQADEVVKALVGTVPKTVSVYRADVVNTCPTETRFFPSRVGFEAATVAPMQDPEAALFAAQNFKDTRWWVVLLKGASEVAKYAGPAALGLSTAGVAVPALVTGLAGGIGGGAVLLDGYRKQASELKVPATWLRDGMEEIIIPPGRDVPYLLALGGKPGETFTAKVGQAVVQTALQAPSDFSDVVQVAGQISITQTHPQIPDEQEQIEAARMALVVRMIQERTAARGAVE